MVTNLPEYFFIINATVGPTDATYLLWRGKIVIIFNLREWVLRLYLSASRLCRLVSDCASIPTICQLFSDLLSQILSLCIIYNFGGQKTLLWFPNNRPNATTFSLALRPRACQSSEVGWITERDRDSSKEVWIIIFKNKETQTSCARLKFEEMGRRKILLVLNHRRLVFKVRLYKLFQNFQILRNPEYCI